MFQSGGFRDPKSLNGSRLGSDSGSKTYGFRNDLSVHSPTIFPGKGVYLLRFLVGLGATGMDFGVYRFKALGLSV